MKSWENVYQWNKKKSIFSFEEQKLNWRELLVANLLEYVNPFSFSVTLMDPLMMVPLYFQCSMIPWIPKGWELFLHSRNTVGLHCEYRRSDTDWFVWAASVCQAACGGDTCCTWEGRGRWKRELCRRHRRSPRSYSLSRLGARQWANQTKPAPTPAFQQGESDRHSRWLRVNRSVAQSESCGREPVGELHCGGDPWAETSSGRQS